MSNIVLAGFPLSVILVVVIQLAKGVGLPTRWAAPAACASGLALAMIYAALSGGVVGVAWLEYAVLGLMAGATAAGLYSGVKAAANGAA